MRTVHISILKYCYFVFSGKTHIFIFISYSLRLLHKEKIEWHDIKLNQIVLNWSNNNTFGSMNNQSLLHSCHKLTLKVNLYPKYMNHPSFIHSSHKLIFKFGLYSKYMNRIRLIHSGDKLIFKFGLYPKHMNHLSLIHSSHK